jgi:hypothetical protein
MEKEQDENALFSLIKLFINCHTHENKDVIQAVGIHGAQRESNDWT